MRMLLKSLLSAGIVSASSFAMAGFTQCPALGANTGCAVLVTVNPDLSIGLAADSTQGPYDGADDTLIGLVNSSATTVSSFTLTSTTDIFGFDGDGIVTYGAPGNAQDPSGYGGPRVYFTNINASATSGTVNIIGGLAAGASTYFSLEEDISGANGGGVGGGLGGGGVTPVPEPATYSMMALGLAGIGALARRKSAK